MTGQPREAQHQLEMGQIYKLKGNLFGMLAMNSDTGRKEMGDGGGGTAVDELNRDGVGVGKGLKQVLLQDGGVQKGAGGA